MLRQNSKVFSCLNLYEMGTIGMCYLNSRQGGQDFALPIFQYKYSFGGKIDLKEELKT